MFIWLFVLGFLKKYKICPMAHKSLGNTVISRVNVGDIRLLLANRQSRNDILVKNSLWYVVNVAKVLNLKKAISFTAAWALLTTRQFSLPF